MKTLDRAVRQIEDAGFGYIKLELEAQLDRDASDDSDCYDCDGRGEVSCYNCDGDGAVDTGETVGVNSEIVYAECGDCDGSGENSCSDCDGSGNRYSDSGYSDEYECQQFIVDRLSDEAKDALVYGNFYNDGSVDSEYTMTIPTSAVHLLPEYIEAFKDLADEIGNGMDVDGAGMHISVLPKECEGSYPVRNWTMPTANARNFARQNQKLLPALFFLASANSRSRGLSYRMPRISDEDKYSAIYTHGDTCFEYRLFETCYDKPEVIFDYIKVIANTLKFYADPTLQAKTLNKTFSFGDSGYSLSRFFDTPDQLKVLNAQISTLKPSDKTIKTLKLERNVPLTVKSILDKQRVRIQGLRTEYQELRNVNNNALKTPLTERQIGEIAHYQSNYGYSPAEAERTVRGTRELPTLTTFINNNLFGNVSRYNSVAV